MRRGTTLRARIVAALVLVALSVLVVAGATTYVLVEATAAEEALDDLHDKSDEVIRQSEAIRDALERAGTVGSGNREELRRFLLQVQHLLRLADARLVFVSSDARLVGARELGRVAALLVGPQQQLLELPEPLTSGDLDLERLVGGETLDGRQGSTVFVARPVAVLPTRAAQHGILVLTQAVHTDTVNRAGPRFLLGALGALLISVAISLWLARRMTKPLRQVQLTARRLADGDLSARVSIDASAEDELASLASTLNAMAAQLEQARGAERAFLLSVSHDLRTPLTSIRGYADALADGTIDSADPQARARAASIIAAEARRLERLVRDLLDLSRLDAREFSLHPRPCDAAAVVREATHAFDPQAGDLGITLVVSDQGTPIPADLDADRLAQIVANLVENALKYASARIVVDVSADASQLEASVVDDGPGIAAEDTSRVFERLYTVRSTPGRAVGTGLGLAIVGELAHAMGGVAHFDPAAQGSRFVVTVPLGTPGAGARPPGPPGG